MAARKGLHDRAVQLHTELAAHQTKLGFTADDPPRATPPPARKASEPELVSESPSPQEVSVTFNELRRSMGCAYSTGSIPCARFAKLSLRMEFAAPGRITETIAIRSSMLLTLTMRSSVHMALLDPPRGIRRVASPSVTPECGVGIYEHDRTQGPACAIAAGAGTIYRNYFAIVKGQTGQSAQSANNQIDCLADIGAALGHTENRLWEMRNGYALASQSGLVEIAHRLQASGESELDSLRQLLRIGIQWNTQVTRNDSKHTVSQAYCSALPVAYSHHPSRLWGHSHGSLSRQPMRQRFVRRS